MPMAPELVGAMAPCPGERFGATSSIHVEETGVDLPSVPAQGRVWYREG